MEVTPDRKSEVVVNIEKLLATSVVMPASDVVPCLLLALVGTAKWWVIRFGYFMVSIYHRLGLHPGEVTPHLPLMDSSTSSDFCVNFSAIRYNTQLNFCLCLILTSSFFNSPLALAFLLTIINSVSLQLMVKGKREEKTNC